MIRLIREEKQLMGLLNTSNIAALMLLLSLSAVAVGIPVEEQGGAVEKVAAFIDSEVEKRLRDPAIFDSEKECMIMCKEVYRIRVDSLKTRMESVSAPNLDISNNIETCNDCFDSFQKFDAWTSTSFPS